jgi:hypothetical protein
LFLAIVANLGMMGIAQADVLYVNNRVGDDTCNGRSVERNNPGSGPVATIQRALELVRSGDTVNIAKTDAPYYESVKLFGHRNSGLQFIPFTIVGNGAIVDGSRLVPPEGWRKIGDGLWKMSPWRKGYYQVLLGGQPVPEHPIPKEARALPEVPAGQWAAWRGSVYYRAKPQEYPPQMGFRIAYHDVGLTLYKVKNVEVRDLTFQHFRLDGVSAPDFARDVVLVNVNGMENGRAGLAVGGTSSLIARACSFMGNLRHDVLQSGRGKATIEPVQATEQPAPAK